MCQISVRGCLWSKSNPRAGGTYASFDQRAAWEQCFHLSSDDLTYVPLDGTLTTQAQHLLAAQEAD